MFSFTFNGKNSFTDYGIEIYDRPVNPLPDRNVSFVEVEGRDGSLTLDDATYKDIIIPIKCLLRNNSNQQAQFKLIKAWLACGYSDLIFSDDTAKKYRAICVNKIDFEQIYTAFGEFTINLRCKPYGYDVTNAVQTLLTSPATVTNTGTVKSLPIIKVTGNVTGANNYIQLTVNSTVIKLYEVVLGSPTFVVIDSFIASCFNDTSPRNNFMKGEFPVLNVGANTISWSVVGTGSVTKVEVTPNLMSI